MSAALRVKDRRQLHEITVRCLQDPVLFGHVFLDWDAHPGQIEWLTQPQKLEELLLTGRRWGKSETEAVKTLHYAFRHPGSAQCIISVTIDQARLIWDEIVAFTTASPLLGIQLAEKPAQAPFPLLSFTNGSTIQARSAARGGLYIRGHKYDRVVVDEADYLADRVIDDVIRMTLADVGGTLVMTTTPKPKRGIVYKTMKAYRDALADGLPCNIAYKSGPTFENPWVDHAFIRAMEPRMTRGAWIREVLGRYADEDEAVFRWNDIERAYTDVDWEWQAEPEQPVPVPRRDSMFASDRPDPKGRYVAGWDLAKEQDWTVCYVLDISGRVAKAVYHERFQRAPWPYIYQRIRQVHNVWNCRRTYIDATGVGNAALDEVNDIAKGFIFTPRSKVELLMNLQIYLEKALIKFPFDRDLVDEMQGYEWDDKELVTDCVMALALACLGAGVRYSSGSLQTLNL